MKEYLDLMQDVLTNGQYRVDRTGVGIYSLFGKRLEFDLSYGLPMITTKRVSFYNILHELIFFLKGDTNIKYLTDKNVHIWDEWADKEGNIGPMYGYQWRSWYAVSHLFNTVANKNIDQLENTVKELKNNPYSRRHIVSAWNVGQLHDMALPPCHVLFQFYVDNDNKLSCQLYQRSADIFLGLPYNITSYSLLTMLIAYHLGMNYGKFIHVIGDAHIYANHVDQCKLQLTREPYTLPYLEIRHSPDMDFLSTPEQINVGLVNYYYHDAIKAPIAI